MAFQQPADGVWPAGRTSSWRGAGTNSAPASTSENFARSHRFRQNFGGDLSVIWPTQDARPYQERPKERARSGGVERASRGASGRTPCIFIKCCLVSRFG